MYGVVWCIAARMYVFHMPQNILRTQVPPSTTAAAAIKRTLFLPEFL